MSGLVVPQIASGLTNEELADIVAKMFKEVEWFANGNISSQNISIIAGYRASDAELKHISGIVGMSGYDPGNPLAVRFWAGHADKNIAPYRVQQDGTVYSTKGYIGGFVIGIDSLTDTSGTFGLSSIETAGDDIRFWAGDTDPSLAIFRVTESGLVYCGGLTSDGGTITGGTIRTAATGARIELTGGVLKGYSSSNNLHGLVFNPTPTSNFFDLFFYHDGVKYAELYDDGLFLKLRPTVSSGLGIGGPAGPIRASNQWIFSGNATFDNDINGKASEAYFADHAATASAADELSPSGEIAWGQVLKAGSDIADIATKNLSSLTQSSSYRTVSDAEKATWNTVTDKANKALPILSVPTLLNSWIDFGGSYANAAYYKDEFNIVHILGLIKGGVGSPGTVIFNLPVGHRPPADLIFTVMSSNAGTATPVAIEISTTGDVKIGLFTAGTTWLSLSLPPFRAA